MELVTKEEAKAVRLCEGCGLKVKSVRYPEGWYSTGRSLRRALIPGRTKSGRRSGVVITAEWCATCSKFPPSHFRVNPTEKEIKKLIGEDTHAKRS